MAKQFPDSPWAKLLQLSASLLIVIAATWATLRKLVRWCRRDAKPDRNEDNETPEGA